MEQASVNQVVSLKQESAYAFADRVRKRLPHDAAREIQQRRRHYLQDQRLAVCQEERQQRRYHLQVVVRAASRCQSGGDLAREKERVWVLRQRGKEETERGRESERVRERERERERESERERAREITREWITPLFSRSP